jgi:hypothetical protein
MGLEEKIPSGFLLTTVEKLAGYMRKNSLWPATFGLACCAIEMMAVGSAAKYDIARFGSEVSPRISTPSRFNDRRWSCFKQDGSSTCVRFTIKCQHQSGFWQWVHVHLQAECSITMQSFKA